MFQDEKIRLIESMPESDTLLIIWIKLLAQAGKTNASGYIYLNEHIPYTEEMLATVFNRPLNTVRLALQTFEQFGMIEINENKFITICNWDKHQNIGGLDKIREQNKLRKQKERERKKLLSVSRDGHKTVTRGHATELELDIELDKEKDKDIIPFSEIIEYLNKRISSNYKASAKKTRDLIQARFNEGFTVDQFKLVIDNKSKEWLNDPKWSKYLRPETLFGNKFESYVNQKGGKSNGAHPATPAEISNLPF